MQIEVHHVDAHVSRPGNAHQGIQVCAIAVHQPAPVVHDLTDLLDVAFEQAQGIRVGDHQRGHVIVHVGFDLADRQDAV